jgi:hypothetical protein
MYRLHFGLHFDSAVWPHLLDRKGQREQVIMGEMQVGPLGLIQFLETHLGLLRNESRQFRSLLAYERALKACDSPQVFYHRSFSHDSQAVSRHLFQWRECLYAAGFKSLLSSEAENAPARIQDLITVEREFQKDWPDFGADKESPYPGIAERMHLILEVLDQHIPEIEILHYDRDLPMHWANFLSALSASGIKQTRVPKLPLAQGDTDLIRFQRSLARSKTGQLSEAEPEEKSAKSKRSEKRGQLDLFSAPAASSTGFKPRPPLADGSLLILKSSNEQDAAAFLSSLWKHNPQSKSVLLASTGMKSLERALVQDQQARHGYSESEQSRELGQILLLLPTLLWEPVDPRPIMALLQLQHKPISQKIARELLKALADYASVGGQEWMQRLQILFEKIEEELGEEELEKQRSSYQKWFDRERFRREDGLTLEALQALVEDLDKWAAQRLAIVEEDAAKERFAGLRQACRQVAEHIDLLQKDGVEKIAENELQRLLRDYLPRLNNSAGPAQLGAMDYFSHPASLLQEEIPNLFWWTFHDKEDRQWDLSYSLNFLNESERRWMREKGLQFEDSEQLAKKQYEANKKAVLQVRSKLVLVIPDSVEGSVLEFHPLYGSLRACFSNQLQKLTFDLDKINSLEQSKSLWANWTLPSSFNYPVEGLDQARPYVKIPSIDLAELDRRESPTSLQKLFFFPHEYALHYLAGLYSGRDFAVNLDNRLLGLLGHRVFENLYAENPRVAYSENEAEIVERVLEQSLAQDGGILELEVYAAERLKFRNIMLRSMRAMNQIIREGNWDIYQIEEAFEGKVGVLNTRARFDLVLTRGNPVESAAAIDFKWGGLKYREMELAKGSDIQLAVYHRLLDEQFPNASIKTGYFILLDAVLLAREDEKIPGSRAIRPEYWSADREDQLRKMKATTGWRFNQFKEGLLEVRTCSTSGEHEVPEDVLTQKEQDNFDPFDLIIEP